MHADYSALGNIAICAIGDSKEEASELVKEASAAITKWSKEFNAKDSDS